MKGRKNKATIDIYDELVKNQLPDVPTEWKLQSNDMKRICKYIKSSIFSEDKCCLWNGYITNMNNLDKGTYVNFYFRNKKVALHRLLYSNYKEPLDSSDYLKCSCENKGMCCNVHHYEKYKYSKISAPSRKASTREPKKTTTDVTVVDPDSDDDLTIIFDM